MAGNGSDAWTELLKLLSREIVELDQKHDDLLEKFSALNIKVVVLMTAIPTALAIIFALAKLGILTIAVKGV